RVVVILIAYAPVEPRAGCGSVGVVAEPYERGGPPEPGAAPPVRQPRDAGGARRADAIVLSQGALVVAGTGDGTRQHDGILDREASALTQVRRGGMGRVAHQHDALAMPCRGRCSIEDVVLQDAFRWGAREERRQAVGPVRKSFLQVLAASRFGYVGSRGEGTRRPPLAAASSDVVEGGPLARAEPLATDVGRVEGGCRDPAEDRLPRISRRTIAENVGAHDRIEPVGAHEEISRDGRRLTGDAHRDA